ncbi:MAG TPA: UDP-N-acetylglucosamine 2-epimerase (non-hydrolyzing) [Chitinophagales bacterium]|nr:UDP-N-acetylglucosamine 2-epimerase (non-hydrolyzing) [Chitinophagales bacterium]
MKVVTIVGARPQFIKAAAVSRSIRKRKNIREILLHTGQHFDANMSAVFFDELEIPKPAYNLDINNLHHGAMTGRMLEGIEEILLKEKPDWVMVYGDTNSTIAGSLAAKKLHLKVAHVEAGMRSFNMRSPEEINRILTDRVSDLLLCSTTAARENLQREGFQSFDCKIILSGDVMYDAALYYSEKAQQDLQILKAIPFKEFVLCTLHREENTDDPATLKHILSALKKIHREIPVVLPLHPRTRRRLKSFDLKFPFCIIDPVGYLGMLVLLNRCEMVITDSGGLQKEAFFFKKFCITLREETEWIELVHLGVNRIAGSDEKKILSAFQFFGRKKFSAKEKPYGTGNASEKIVNALIRYS